MDQTSTISKIDQRLAALREEWKAVPLALDRGIILRRARALEIAKAKLLGKRKS